MNPRSCFLAGWLCLSGLVGCSGHSQVTVNEILNSEHCNTLQRGVTQVSFDELAKIRGVIMLQDPQHTKPPDTEAPALFAVFNGERTSAGYRLNLLGAEQRSNHIALNYEWRTPKAGSVQAQVMTAPCSVVELGNLDGIAEISAHTEQQEIGRLQLAQ